MAQIDTLPPLREVIAALSIEALRPRMPTASRKLCGTPGLCRRSGQFDGSPVIRPCCAVYRLRCAVNDVW